MNNSVILTFYFFFLDRRSFGPLLHSSTVHTIGLVRSQCNDALVRTPPAEWCERSDESGYRKEASCTLPLVLVGTGDVGGGDRVRARAMRMCEADRPEQQAPRQPQPRPVERQDHRSSIIQPTTSNRSLRLRIEPPCLIICFFFPSIFPPRRVFWDHGHRRRTTGRCVCAAGMIAASALQALLLPLAVAAVLSQSQVSLTRPTNTRENTMQCKSHIYIYTENLIIIVG